MCKLETDNVRHRLLVSCVILLNDLFGLTGYLRYVPLLHIENERCLRTGSQRDTLVKWFPTGI